MKNNDFYFIDLDKTVADYEARLTAAEENIQGIVCAFNGLTSFLSQIQ